MKKRNPFSIPSSILLALLVLCALVTLSACGVFNGGRLLYDQQGIRIGVEPDPSMSRFGQPVLNNHPVDLSPKDLQSLLQVLEVSGYSGTLVGLFANSQPVPLFN